MKYVQEYHRIQGSHIAKPYDQRSWALEGEVLNLLFENAQLQAQIEFLKGGSDVA